MRPLSVLVALVVAMTLSVGPASAKSTREAALAVPANATLALTGHGYGHGHGMSQYGAQSAARQGLSAQQIAEFYYPQTTWGTAAGRIRVLIGADTSPDVVVVARAGLVVQQVGTATRWDLAALQPDAGRWRIVPLAGGRSAIGWRAGGHWHRQAVTTGTLQFRAHGAPISLVEPDGQVRAYRGALRSAVLSAPRDRDTVNVLSLEAYLRGVVPQEMPALWSPAAVQAQAIAARTYAAYERAHRTRSWYDICDSGSCQVYGGYDVEHPASDAAVAATKGRILTYAGGPAFTQFSSSDGGWSTAGGQAYLPAQEDPYDDWSGNPNHTWTTTLTAAQIQRYWPALGTLRQVQVTKRDGNGQWGGRVLSLTLTGSDGSVTLSGEAFRSAWGLKSTWFTFALAS